MQTDYREINIVEWKNKMRSDDRTLVLQIKPGTKALSSIGTVDQRLFKGENRLRAIRDPRLSYWTLKYDMGIIPPPLQQKFITWDDLMLNTKKYFDTRNIDIVDIVDNYEQS